MNPFQKEHKQLSIFVTAGYPLLNSLPEKIEFLSNAGVDFVEIGVPFSDPLADGPIIQASSSIALQNGMTLPILFKQLAGMTTKIPLVLMSYLNPIIHFGVDAFLLACKETGIRHLIIPDLTLEVYERFYQATFETNGITLCFLVAPCTQSERIHRMAHHSRNGFIYLVSSSMTTGNTSTHNHTDAYLRIRAACGTTPMMIGFGIRTVDDVRHAHAFGDGAIIGSAYIQSIETNNEEIFIQDVLAH